MTAANVNDTTMFQAVVADVPQVRWDRDAGRWFAFVLVAWAVVCFDRL